MTAMAIKMLKAVCPPTTRNGVVEAGLRLVWLVRILCGGMLGQARLQRVTLLTVLVLRYVSLC